MSEVRSLVQYVRQAAFDAGDPTARVRVTSSAPGWDTKFQPCHRHVRSNPNKRHSGQGWECLRLIRCGHDGSPSRSIQVDQRCRCGSRAPEYAGSAKKWPLDKVSITKSGQQRRAARYPALDQNPSRLRQPIVLPFRPVRKGIREISDEITFH